MTLQLENPLPYQEFSAPIAEAIDRPLQITNQDRFVDAIDFLNGKKPRVLEHDIKDPIYDRTNPVSDIVKVFCWQTETMRSPTGFYLDRKFGNIETENMYFAPLKTRGGSTSAHGVFFGDIMLQDGKKIQVAVKPFDDTDHRSAAAYDYFKNAAVRDLGMRTFEPVGLFLADNATFSITLLEPTSGTLEADNWKTFLPQRAKNVGMSSILEQVSVLMADMHNKGIMHGDLAARNIACDAMGKTFFIDWEHARISLEPPRDEEMAATYAYKDLSVLLESFCLPRSGSLKQGVELLTSLPPEQRWEVFNELVFKQYCSVRMNHCGKDGEKLSQTIAVLRDLETQLKEYASVH